MTLSHWDSSFFGSSGIVESDFFLGGDDGQLKTAPEARSAESDVVEVVVVVADGGLRRLNSAPEVMVKVNWGLVVAGVVASETLLFASALLPDSTGKSCAVGGAEQVDVLGIAPVEGPGKAFSSWGMFEGDNKLVFCCSVVCVVSTEILFATARFFRESLRV